MARLVGLQDRWNLIWSFTRRLISERYRGSALGLVWAFINPLVALALWTFLFTTVIRLRHAGAGGAAGYAILLWAGMIPWIAFSESMNGAMTCIRNNGTLIKKTLFPVEVLPIASVLAGFAHSLFALVILIPVLLLTFDGLPWQVVLLPGIFVFQLVLTLAIAYPVSVATTLVRDAGPIIANLLTTLMYLTPIIYPLEAIPDPYRQLMLANPLAVVVVTYRDILLDGENPAWTLLGVHFVVALLVLFLARRAFQRQRHVFAEVL